MSNSDDEAIEKGWGAIFDSMTMKIQGSGDLEGFGSNFKK
jgi:hypothetical protein